MNTRPTCEYVTVTPDTAQEWLSNTAKNRKISARRVGLYAAAMKRGDWLLTNQGVAIDEFGRLIDGQHRLRAIVESQTPVELLVIHAAPNKSQLGFRSRVEATATRSSRLAGRMGSHATAHGRG